MLENKRKYEIALSFAGEDRAYAEAIASSLKNQHIAVFYDGYEKAQLWGKDLYTHLSDLYQNQAEYCVMIISRHYAQKLWTNHERKSAQARAFQENKEYILPIRIDNTEIPGIPNTVGYLSWHEETIDSITGIIIAKLRSQTPVRAIESKATIKHPISWDILQPIHFESFDSADAKTDSPETLKAKFNDIWLPYQEDIWTATITDGTYFLKNASDPTAVKYKFLKINDEDMTVYPASVEVKANLKEGTFLSGGGLICRYDRSSKDYYAFVISRDGKFSFYRRQDGTYIPLYSGRSNVIQADQFNKLSIVGTQSLFGLYINDHLVKVLNDPILKSGDIGIIAMGIGEFYFDNLTVYESIER